MPRFFFDIHDGTVVSTDQDGLERSSIEEARAEAETALAEMMRDAESRRRSQLVATIRDENGPVMRVSLTPEALDLQAGAHDSTGNP